MATAKQDVVETAAIIEDAARSTKKADETSPAPKEADAKQKDGKDIRRHPKYGFYYEVKRYNALYHVRILNYVNDQAGQPLL